MNIRIGIGRAGTYKIQLSMATCEQSTQCILAANIFVMFIDEFNLLGSINSDMS